MNHPMHQFHIMMRQQQQQQQQQILLSGKREQRHQSQQTAATGAIQPSAATGKDSMRRGHRIAGHNVAGEAGAGTCGELELGDNGLGLCESHRIQDPRQHGSSNRKEFSPSQLVLRDCSSSPSDLAFKFDIDLVDFWDGEPCANVQHGELEKVSGICSIFSSKRP